MGEDPLVEFNAVNQLLVQGCKHIGGWILPIIIGSDQVGEQDTKTGIPLLSQMSSKELFECLPLLQVLQLGNVGCPNKNGPSSVSNFIPIWRRQTQ